MNYECSCCHREVFISHSAAWPEQCPHCRTWHPGFQSPGFDKVIQPLSTSVIQPGLSIRVPLG